MKKLFLVMAALLAALAMVLILSSCANPTGNGGGGDNLSADDWSDLGYTRMSAGNWEGALDAFSKALIKDSTHEKAMAGYTLMYVASISNDEDMRDLISDDLGIEGFPETMCEVYSPGWLTEVVLNGETASPYSVLLPDIVGMEDFRSIEDDDGDGEYDDTDDPVGPFERVMALCRNFATSGESELNHSVATIATALGNRLASAVNALNNAPDIMAVTFTWSMFTDDPGILDYWPTDQDDNPLEITIGKAEARGVVAWFLAVEAYLHILQAYDFALPLSEYWTSYNPVDGSGSHPTTTPFMGNFLGLTGAAGTHMTAAGDALEEAFAEAKLAANAIRLRQDDSFTFSENSGVIDASTWENIEYGLLMTEGVAAQCVASLASPSSSVYAVFPIGDFQVQEDLANWPKASDIGTSAVGVNLGRFFSTPVSLIASFVELNKGDPLLNPDEHEGEPVWYKLNASSGSFSKVTAANLPAGPAYDFSSRDGTIYYWHAPDATLGGVGHIDNIPLDDPSTRYSYFMMGYDDNVIDNDKWDEGEKIYDAGLNSELEGFIDLSLVSTKYGTNHSPFEWYFQPDFSSYDGQLDGLVSSYTSNPAALWAALDGANSVNISGGTGMAFTFLNTATKELFYSFGIPDYWAWHSYTSEGTSGKDWEGGTITSTGSFWWAGLEEAMGGK